VATVFYARVSTTDQNLEHQQAQALAAGFTTDRVVANHGVSGVSVAFADRPNGKRLFDILRKATNLVHRSVEDGGDPKRQRSAQVILKSNWGNYQERTPSSGRSFRCLSAFALVADRYFPMKCSRTKRRIVDVRLPRTRSRSIRLVRSVGEIRFSLAISFNASQKASSRLILVDVPSGLVNDCFRGVVGLFSSGMLKFLRASSKSDAQA
jgi:hypothetical protein